MNCDHNASMTEHTEGEPSIANTVDETCFGFTLLENNSSMLPFSDWEAAGRFALLEVNRYLHDRILLRQTKEKKSYRQRRQALKGAPMVHTPLPTTCCAHCCTYRTPLQQNTSTNRIVIKHRSKHCWKTLINGARRADAIEFGADERYLCQTGVDLRRC